jgi:hypothetical protein
MTIRSKHNNLLNYFFYMNQPEVDYKKIQEESEND